MTNIYSKRIISKRRTEPPEFMAPRSRIGTYTASCRVPGYNPAFTRTDCVYPWRTARLSWLDTYRDVLLARRRSPIPVLTGLDVE